MARAGLGGGMGRLGARGRYGASAAAVGGAALLVAETNGFAADFTYATDAQRVAVKTSGTVVSSGTNFFTNGGVSSKWAYNSSGTLVNVAAGSLAVDYNPTTLAARGLLVEPAATNTVLRSSEFDNATWTKNTLAVTANAIAAPDGTTTADACIPPAGPVSPFLSQGGAATTNGSPATVSVYAKNGTLGTPWLEFLVISGTNREAWFNLSTGVKGTTAGSVTSSNMVALPNGWYRCDITFTAAATAAAVYFALRDADGGGGGITTGDGVKPCFYLWGAQVEAGTVATSHIPTTSATVTRAADGVKVTPASINYSATAGSWWFDLSVNAFGAAGQDRIVGYTTGSNTPINISSGTAFTLYDGVAFFSRTVASVLGSHKVAVAFASADRAITADGLAVTTNTSAGTALLSPGANIAFGNSTAGTEPGNLYIRKLRYVPRRKTNPEMVTETT